MDIKSPADRSAAIRKLERQVLPGEKNRVPFPLHHQVNPRALTQTLQARMGTINHVLDGVSLGLQTGFMVNAAVEGQVSPWAPTHSGTQGDPFQTQTVAV